MTFLFKLLQLFFSKLSPYTGVFLKPKSSQYNITSSHNFYFHNYIGNIQGRYIVTFLAVYFPQFYENKNLIDSLPIS